VSAGVHVHHEGGGVALAPGCLAHPSRLSGGEAVVLMGWDILPPGTKQWVTRDKLRSWWEPFEYGGWGEPLHRAQGTWRLG